jgi:hypothetical protein
VNHARRDLCGGHPAMGVPTAKGHPSPVLLSPVPGDKVATGWREGIELLKLTGLLAKPNNCARYALERSSGRPLMVE